MLYNNIIKILEYFKFNSQSGKAILINGKSEKVMLCTVLWQVN